MKINMNTLFDKLTNFKIKFTENPSPIQIGNKGLVFVIGDYQYDIKDIKWNKDLDRIEIHLK